MNLQANTGCITAMFGGSLICEAKRSDTSKVSDGDNEHGSTHVRDGNTEDHHNQVPLTQIDSSSYTEIISHPYQPFNKCFANSRVLIAHYADCTLVNRSGKLLAHCIIDYCLPRYMYSSALGSHSLDDCKEHLLTSITSVRQRLKRATMAFNSVMNNCPEHMIPVCGTSELEHLRINRETVARLPGEKLEVCSNVITKDISLQPSDVYRNLSASLGKRLTEAIPEGILSLVDNDSCSAASILLSLPIVMLRDAGITYSTTGRISIVRSELCERTLVDLAGLLYQTVLMLQIQTPDAFSSGPVMYPESVLCIMPYCCADTKVMRTWIETFREKKWIAPVRAKLGKRSRPLSDCSRVVTYHCTGCKNFYKDLFTNNIPGHRLIQRVYGEDKKRRIGRCVNERRWLS